MRALIQRVVAASVQVEGQMIAQIQAGMLILLGITHTDGPQELEVLAKKIAGLRIFEDEQGKMNLSIGEIGGTALVVSQFTLYADTRKGRRPSFTQAARPEQAEPLYQAFCRTLKAEGVPVAQGIFQAAMQVSLVNDGPVTLWLDTAELNPDLHARHTTVPNPTGNPDRDATSHRPASDSNRISKNRIRRRREI